MLQFPAPLTASSFLEQHWQKEPLFMPGGLPLTDPAVGADDLAWLATQPDVESRLVITEHGRTGTRYRVQQGPFGERRLRRLPAENWTLLVHDVEKHLPEFRRYCDAAPFVPDWRIDDLLISVAAPGGGVGPHRDAYDVFLCQASGRREWRLAAPQDAVPARRRGALALLEPFESPAPVTAGPSDVLYLPPSVPHWGIALETCITCSLGMRAPTRNELAAALRAVVREDSPDVFYADPDLQPDESQPGMISGRALERAARLIDASGVPLARAVGIAVTTPKEWLAPELPAADEIDALVRHLAGAARVRIHGMARLAWCMPRGESPLVFVNGRGRAASPESLVGFRHLCGGRLLERPLCAEWSTTGAGLDFLRWLIGSGAFDLADAEV